MLTADAIEQAWRSGLVHISPFNKERINPNSYNLQLGPKVMEVRPNDLDEATGNWFINPELPTALEDVEVVKRHGKSYWLLQPNRLYLGHTVEEFGSDHLIACIVGRSTYARNGFAFSYDAGFGDLGFKKQWTLEIVVVTANSLLPFDCVPIQGHFFLPSGKVDRDRLYKGKYVNQSGVTAGKLHEELRSK